MNVELSDVERAWQEKGRTLGQEVAVDGAAGDVVDAAARLGLLDAEAGLLAVVLATEAAAAEAPSPALAFALHQSGALSLSGRHREAFATFYTGERVCALTLATDEVPDWRDGRLYGRASWVAPLTRDGVALVGARAEGELVAVAVSLRETGLVVDDERTAGLHGLATGHLRFDGVPADAVGSPVPIMSRARILVAAVGLGIARRAVREALTRARGTSEGAGGEQTVQGLIADAATELDAAMLLTWKAALAPLSLGLASVAKLAATGAAQRAVERATQVIGADSFRSGHIISRLAEDVRALELFAGRTEALREAFARERGLYGATS